MQQTLAYVYIAIMVAVLAPITAVIWVVADATAIKREEVFSCGESDCEPFHWAAAVLLLPIVAIPMYIKFRNRRTAQLDAIAASVLTSD